MLLFHTLCRIFNKSFLLKAFLEYFCMCSAEHSCVKVQCRAEELRAGPAPVHVKNKLWALGLLLAVSRAEMEPVVGLGMQGQLGFTGLWSHF